jgi:hypothetical protein
MELAVSRKKQRLISAASAGVKGGESLVFEAPGRGALIMIPIAHSSANSGSGIAVRKISGRMVRIKLSIGAVSIGGNKALIYSEQSAAFSGFCNGSGYRIATNISCCQGFGYQFVAATEVLWRSTVRSATRVLESRK